MMPCGAWAAGGCDRGVVHILFAGAHTSQHAASLTHPSPHHPPGVKGGRRITPAGQKDMDLIAGRVVVKMPTMGFAPAVVAAE
jgi:hypothetical protein